MPTGEVQKAKDLFQKAGLEFPKIPDKLAAQLKERDKWVFSTRETNVWPYDLDHYVREYNKTHVDDYAVLAHSGHGVNSYALQYYIVYGRVGMFLHLGWGGIYSDAEADAAKIRDCFLLADKIIVLANAIRGSGAADRLTVVGSDFYGSYWSLPDKGRVIEKPSSKRPAEVLAEVFDWLTNVQGPVDDHSTLSVDRLRTNEAGEIREMKASVAGIGRRIVACDAEKCAGIERDLSVGILPRCLIWEEPESAGCTTNGCAIVGINPGRAEPEEMQHYQEETDGATYEAFVRYWEGSLKSVHRYYTRPRELVRAFGLDGPILWTELAKCQSEANVPLPLETLRACSGRFLSEELSLIPARWPLVALGKEAFTALAYMYPRRTVIGVPHPTGARGDAFLRHLPGNKSYGISNAAVRNILALPPGHILWLGDLGKNENPQ